MDISSIAQVIKSNPILATGAGLGVGGSIFASLRQIPGTLFGLGKRQIMTTVNIQSGDLFYERFQEWMHEQGNLKTRNLQAVTICRYSDDSSVSEKSLNLVPAPGPHTFKYKGRRVWINIHRDKPDNHGNRVEDITLTVIGLDGGIILDLLREVESLYYRRKDNFMRVYIQQGVEWQSFTRKKPRPLDTVILPDATKSLLLKDLQRFKEGEERYESLGLPYRRGYLLFGPPGNGKSSIAEALCGQLGYDLYLLSLAAPMMSDQSLLSLMSKVPANGILLIEDVDAAFNKRETKESSSDITFSGVLNAIDGVGSRPGQVVIMSTNHIENLDPALLRPGRADVKCFIDNATPLQGMQLFERFFPHSPLSYDFLTLLEASEPISMATLQGHLNSCACAKDALEKPIK